MTDDDLLLLKRVGRAYDSGIVVFGLGSAATGHVAGGLAVTAIGLVPLAFTFVAGPHRGRNPDGHRSPGGSCTRR